MTDSNPYVTRVGQNRLRIRASTESPGPDGTVGDGFVVIGPDDEGYAANLAYLEAWEHERDASSR